MRKIRVLPALAAAIVTVALVAPSASAVSAPKATGSIALATPMQYVSFNAFDYGAPAADRGTVQYTNFEFAVPGTGVWMISPGSYTLDVLLGGHYVHTMTVDTVTPMSPTATAFTGHGFFNDGGYDWTMTGSTAGANITFAITYTTGLPGYVFSATGAVAGDGSIVGTATDTLLRDLTWTLAAGTAHEVFSYTAPVTNVVVAGSSATFEYTIPVAPLVGFRVFVAMTDGGSPGTHDTWQFFGTTSYLIVGGNLVVHG